MQDSIGPELKYAFDMPSLDMKRDLVFEEGRKLRNNVYYDVEAAEYTHYGGMEGNMTPENAEKFNAMAEMLPPRPEDEPTMAFKELVEEEFGNYQEIEKRLVGMRSQIAEKFVYSRDLYDKILTMRKELVMTTQEKLAATTSYQPHPKPLSDILGLEQKKI